MSGGVARKHLRQMTVTLVLPADEVKARHALTALRARAVRLGVTGALLLLLAGCCGPNVNRMAAFSLRQSQRFGSIANTSSHSAAVRATAASAEKSHRTLYEGLVAPEDRQ